MKIILSRKGFDSGTGGVPSPIFPDGSMCSLPIQAPGGRTRYSTIHKGADETLGSVVRDLSRNRIAPDEVCHFDPDLSRGSLHQRHPSWVPSLGQVNAAAGHLANQGVGVGDVFVFYGWFRRVARGAGMQWSWVPKSPHLHVIFGWLRIGAVIDVPKDARGMARLIEENAWMAEHPHLHFPPGYVRGPNRIYAGATKDDGDEFTRFDPRLVLTAPNTESRGVWRLPKWFAPTARRSPMSYHTRPDRWTIGGDHCLVRTVGRGQEFVLDCANRPEAQDWIGDLIEAHTPRATRRTP